MSETMELAALSLLLVLYGFVGYGLGWIIGDSLLRRWMGNPWPDPWPPEAAE